MPSRIIYFDQVCLPICISHLLEMHRSSRRRLDDNLQRSSILLDRNDVCMNCSGCRRAMHSVEFNRADDLLQIVGLIIDSVAADGFSINAAFYRMISPISYTFDRIGRGINLHIPAKDRKSKGRSGSMADAWCRSPPDFGQSRFAEYHCE